MNKCKLCINTIPVGTGAYGLCHKHTNAFYRISKVKPRLLKRLLEISEIERIVYGENKTFNFDISGTHFNCRNKDSKCLTKFYFIS